MGPDLVLGVDGGGTKTLCAVAARDGSVCFLERGPSIDPFAGVRWEATFAALIARVASSVPPLSGAAIGFPCYGEVAAVSRAQGSAAARELRVPHVALNDVHAAFEGALAGDAGILLLAGTGAMAWAGNGGTREIRVGGWGEAFGDEGSAVWIGRQALSTATRALDGRSDHRWFAQQLLDRLDVTAETLIGWFYGEPNRRQTIGLVARHVDALAEAGDPLACAILVEAADHLADHAVACQVRLGLPGDIAWSFAGSVFNSRTVAAQVTDRLGRTPTPPRLPPVGGALLRAAHLRGWPVDAAWISRLSQELAQADLPGVAPSQLYEGAHV